MITLTDNKLTVKHLNKYYYKFLDDSDFINCKIININNLVDILKENMTIKETSISIEIITNYEEKTKYLTLRESLTLNYN